MKPMRTFFQQTSIKALLGIEKPIYDISHGKLAKNRFLSAVPVNFVGSKVKILKETETSTYIAKYNDNDTIDNGDFVIMNATDLHLYENQDDINKTLKMLCRHIETVKPDLVIFTGDVVLSKYQQIDAIQFAELMEKLGVYWAYVFGNHEAREEKEYFKYLLMKSMAMYPHCLTKFGKPELFGYGNFIINIMNSETELKQSLVFFDSGRNISEPHRTNDNVPSEMMGYDYIKPSQIQWYTDEINALKKTYGTVKSMLYMHIPIPEYNLIFKLRDDGFYEETGAAKVLYGGMYEGVGCSAYNSHLFDAMKKNGSQAVFSGHDHFNDFAALYDGILLVYNQYGGYNTYPIETYIKDHPNEKSWIQGVTLTYVHSNGDIDLKQEFNSKFL